MEGIRFGKWVTFPFAMASTGEKPAWRKVLFSEYDYSMQQVRRTLNQPIEQCRLFMVFDGRWKYIHASGFRPMLYDLESDPQEFLDRGDDPDCAPIIARLQAALFDWALHPNDHITTANEKIVPKLQEGYRIEYGGQFVAKQDATSGHPGSFVGGEPLRTAFIWSQGTILSGLMGYHEMTGDPRAVEAAERLATWYGDYLDNGDLAAANYFAREGKFSREGATVGHLGKGALEPMVWLYWRTKEPKYLDYAKRIAELRRRYGGTAWMIRGDVADLRPEYESWHLHANLSTIRGFPWLYAATGDRSYLDDAVAACDRVYERATWGIGCVLEGIAGARVAQRL